MWDRGKNGKKNTRFQGSGVVMDYWIAVVDDETLSLTNAKNLLDAENMKVSCFKSGKDLMRFLNKSTPDLILLDILMPEMDGFETYKAIRYFEDETGRRHVPVIFLTGENDSDMERRGLRAGASDFIHKPFNKDILVSRIRNTIVNSKTIESLTEEATVDKLTGFLNKISGNSKISGLCSENSGTLMILDLDNFKLVNDLFGHDMGDQMLRAFSDIVRHNIRETDVVSRIGGDEFMGFFIDMTEESAVRSLTERLNAQLLEEAARLMGRDHGIPLGISVGAVMIPEHGRDYESLFTLADNSLYTVKQNGKHGYSIYEQTGSEDFDEKDDLDREIDRVTKIIEERNDRSGALMLGREPFAIAYRFVTRLTKRYGGIVVRLIFEISSGEDEKSCSVLSATEHFGEILRKHLRGSDLIMKNRSNQYFVILNSRKTFSPEAVANRVISVWNGTEYGKKTSIGYSFKYKDYFEENKGGERETSQ